MHDSPSAAREAVEARSNQPPVMASFPCFDGLRAIAALSVFGYHVYLTYYPIPSGSWIDAETRRVVIQLGSFGVSIFFLISGFLLYRPFVVAHFASRPAPPVVPFWIRRAFRIFPAYWLALTVFVYGFGSYHIHSFSAFVTYYGLLQTYRAGFQSGGLGVAWTLVIELSFYAFLPFFAIAIRAVQRRGSASAKLWTNLAGIAALYGVAMGFRLWRLWFSHPPTAHFGQLFPIEQVGSWLISYLDWFALGMLLAVASVWERGGHHLPRVVDQLGRHAWACWLLAAGCYAIIVSLRLGEPFTYIKPMPQFEAFFLFGLTALFMLLPAVFGPQDRGAVRGLLRTRVMVAFGLISYGIYLWHTIVADEVFKWVTRGDLPSGMFAGATVMLTLTVVVASISYFVVEKPLIRFSRHISARHR